MVTKTVPGRMAAKAAAPNIPRVSGASGQCRLTTSLAASRVGRSAGSAPFAAISSRDRYGSWASTRQPNAAATIRATSPPTWPQPTRPTVRPESSRPICAVRSRASPARIRAWDSGMRLSSASIIATACSATPRALPPAWLTHSTPASVQATGSIVS